jgi:glycyl-tRNA synthetase
MENSLQKIINLAKRRGFIFPSCEIYGGLEGIWDLGPLGSLMKEEIKKFWIKRFVFEKENVVFLEGSCLMSSKVWEASGHLKHFSDPLIECKNCHFRYRQDEIESGKFVGQGKSKEKNQCPNCGGFSFTEKKMFNLMFKTFLGPTQERIIYLRPETAQSMFTNFKNVLNSMRLKLPFGIAQIGRCFRNEITVGDFIFRTREFDIGEIEYFVKPEEADYYFEFWLKEWEKFFFDLGIKKENLRRFEHSKDSLAHYSRRTVDIQYRFPFGWAELAGVANRGDYDLKNHAQFSGEDLTYFDEKDKKRYFPFVIEPTLGIERLILALLCDAYEEIEGGRTKTTTPTKEKEILLKLDKKVAPVKVAVLPLVKNNEKLVEKAKEVWKLVRPYFYSLYDEAGSIGRRYRRQDEIGTIFCLTIDFQSLKENDLTIRDRDTMAQERVKIENLISVLKRKLEY